MSEKEVLPLTRAEALGRKPVRLVRAAVRIAVVVHLSDRIECLFVRHKTKGWELPGGAIEYDETPLQAGTREVSEEAGILLPIQQPASVIAMVPVRDPRGGNWLDIIYGMVVTPQQVEIRQKAELPISWLTAEEIEYQVDKRLSSYAAARAFLRENG